MGNTKFLIQSGFILFKSASITTITFAFKWAAVLNKFKKLFPFPLIPGGVDI